ncbi:group II intron-encoded protein LtrA [Nephila pilipes]|uniref:Group II intron-encoded protein LtrA n=1 Tax=Nephila pilipes TaxID=299642 RepID=A0A8X6QH78_NEPPI|nr:group II intron-encoded protein LtrA [Nephila pilipes]
MPKVIFGICRHCNLEGKVVNSSEYVVSEQNVRCEWNKIPWHKLEKSSLKLQKRIYRASKCNDIKKMHKFQRLLLKSTSAKMLAVRSVTQDNRGKKTAGIEGRSNLNKKREGKVIKKGMDPKFDRLSEYRPLGIFTIVDRAKQTLVKMALELEWEAKFEPNTYGFRSGRSCHDAIASIFIALGQKTVLVLDTDMYGCFDNIKHSTLLEKLNTTPTLKRIIKGVVKILVAHLYLIPKPHVSFLTHTAPQ